MIAQDIKGFVFQQYPFVVFFIAATPGFVVPGNDLGFFRNHQRMALPSTSEKGSVLVPLLMTLLLLP